MIIKIAFWTLFALTCSHCSTVALPDIEVCTIERQIDAGATCATSNSQSLRRIRIDEFLQFLEPNDVRPGALCVSTTDWVALKISLEQLCSQVKCQKNVKTFLERALKNVEIH